jgi:hypothetical protein
MLRLIEKFAPGMFEPEVSSILSAAFDAAWQQLKKSGARLDSEYRIEQARDTLGRYIIEQASKGERDVHQLSEGALLYYTQAILRRK